MKSVFKILILLLLLLLADRNAEAGNCIPSGTTLTLTRQSEVDSFPINYPGCDVVEGGLIISGNDITNLYGLLGIKIIGFNLEIIDNPSLNNLSVLDSLKNCVIHINLLMTDYRKQKNVDTLELYYQTQ